ncbi:heme biosynthesis protein HemY [Neorhizobium sp. JUb45]|uniref:heme biosynthesis protein HemY n=1 Tax=unclassified Neorhizobium TaxID=2629175 RepID=UPI0010469434|nr:heme biosynthesis protein HemY [Neorhizobium sp. JUb45]TCR01214.1 HemY protein [Neorhizobium sp. JUb45]
MIRLFIFAIVVLGLGWSFSWLADRPGLISITWQGQLIETSLMVAATLLVAIVAAMMFIGWLVRIIWSSPHLVQRHFRARKRDRGYQALSTGLIAAGAGNATLARKMSLRSRSLIRADQEPLILLLEAQTALIEGKHDEARSIFEAMSQDPETREIGLRGLYMEARRLGADEAARQYAESAAENAPYLPWAAQATLEYRCQAGRWDDAIRLLDQQRIAGVIERDKADRWKAVLLTAKAGEKLEGDPRGARDDATAALKLAKDLVPAGIIAAKAYARENNLRKTASVLESIWKITPHPDVAETYVRARSGDSTADRLKRAEKLEAMRPNNVESLIAVARAALDARDFDKARAKAEAAARIDSREGVYLLLADIEEADTGDQGRVRHWMGQALRAPRDPSWVADGIVSDHWLPVSPATGRLDAFEWKAPFGQLEGPVEEGRLAETAIASLPAVHTAPERTDVKAAETKSEQKTSTVAEPTPAPSPAQTETQKFSPLTFVKIEEKPIAKPAPTPARTPATAQTPVPAKTDTAPSVAEPDPFNGRPPDDPGVKDQAASNEAPTRLRLY